MAVDLASPFGKYALLGRRKLAFDLAQKFRSKKVINLVRAIGGLRNFGVADVEVYGGKMRLFSDANRSDKQMIAKSHIFDRREREALAEFLRGVAAPSFIDIGANIGAYSVFVKGLGLGTKIIAIEADEVILQRLKFNLPDGATILNMAVAAEEGAIPFYINEASRGQNSLVAGEGMQKIEVTARRLLQVLDDCAVVQPTALKIDVEGAEFGIFSKFFSEAPRARWPLMVLVEYYFDSETVRLLLEKGYQEVLRTKMNTVLRLLI